MLLTKLEEQEISKYVDEFDFKQYLMDHKTILVTGSKGIVGSGLIKLLLYMNQYKGTNVHIIASTRTPHFKPDYIQDGDDIEYCSFDHEDVECFGKHIDYIVHAAAPTSNKTFKAEPVESMNVIINGTVKMLELAKKHNATMLYVSSEEAYGTPNCDFAIDETYVGAVNSLNTRSCYPLGKKVAELYCRSYYEEYGVSTRIIRPTVILGLWQAYDSVKVESEILRCIIENKNLIMQSDGSTQKSVIYSLDAISAILTVLFCGEDGEAYNATNPDTFCSVRDRAYNMFREFNDNVTVEFALSDDSQKNGYLPKRSLLEDVSKISELGWKPLADMSYIYNVDMKRFCLR